MPILSPLRYKIKKNTFFKPHCLPHLKCQTRSDGGICKIFVGKNLGRQITCDFHIAIVKQLWLAGVLYCCHLAADSWQLPAVSCLVATTEFAVSLALWLWGSSCYVFSPQARITSPWQTILQILALSNPCIQPIIKVPRLNVLSSRQCTCLGTGCYFICQGTLLITASS